MLTETHDIYFTLKLTPRGSHKRKVSVALMVIRGQYSDKLYLLAKQDKDFHTESHG